MQPTSGWKPATKPGTPLAERDIEKIAQMISQRTRKNPNDIKKVLKSKKLLRKAANSNKTDQVLREIFTDLNATDAKALKGILDHAGIYF